MMTSPILNWETNLQNWAVRVVRLTCFASNLSEGTRADHYGVYGITGNCEKHQRDLGDLTATLP